MKRIYKMVLMVYHRVKVRSSDVAFVFLYLALEIGVWEVSIGSFDVKNTFFCVNLTIENAIANGAKTMTTGLISQLT